MPTTVSWPIRRDYLAPSLTIREREFAWGSRTYLMGVINVTPDSFSGDGLGADPLPCPTWPPPSKLPCAHILDVGGQSSRPWRSVLDPAERWPAGFVPCIEAVRAASTLPIRRYLPCRGRGMGASVGSGHE